MLDLKITKNDIDQLEKEFGGKLSFDESRRKVLKYYDDVQACPGSGKTTLVAAKLILLAKKWTKTYQGICVLTHTNAAKNEIIKWLQSHPSGHKLLTYPHFVGTIQECIDRFLGIPYCKSEGWEIQLMDSESYAKELLKVRWKYFIKKGGSRRYQFLYFVNSMKINFRNFIFEIQDGRLNIHSDFMKAVTANIDLDASNVPNNYFEYKKTEICRRGLFQYRDMYVLGEKLIHDNPHVKTSLQKRFPLVFIDEMQDTQKFQDDLINQIFGCDEVVLQCFGDPDQAIFDGLSGEKPNLSYNCAHLDSIITDSHRFGNDIACKIKGLSYNKLLDLGSCRQPPGGSAPHTIFLYDDQSIKQVLPAFGQLAATLTKDQRKTVKAIGGIGKENPNGLTIKHYWDGYDKSKAPKSFRAARLINIVKKCSEHKHGNVSDNYDLLLQGILDLLRKANKKTKSRKDQEVHYSKYSLIKELKNDGRYEKLRQLLTAWIMHGFPSRDMWAQHMKRLKVLLGLYGTMELDAQDFITYDNHLPPEQEDQLSVTNSYQCDNGLEIEVSTIHGIKGQTHDATLILETKYNRYWDIKESLVFFIDEGEQRPPEDHDHPKQKTSIQASFLKKLYVAASRPRHLLCLAIHKEHISNEQFEALNAKGWNIASVYTR